MAESLLVRKGGGGAKIEEAFQNFIVAPGETITAGNFVRYLKNVDIRSSVNSVNTIDIDAINLENNDIMVTFRDLVNNHRTFVQIFTIKNNQILSKNREFIVENTSGSGYIFLAKIGGSAVRKVFIVYSAGATAVRQRVLTYTEAGVITVGASIDGSISNSAFIDNANAKSNLLFVTESSSIWWFLFVYRNSSDQIVAINLSVTTSDVIRTPQGATTIEPTAPSYHATVSKINDTTYIIGWDRSSSHFTRILITVNGQINSTGAIYNLQGQISAMQNIVLNQNKVLSIYRVMQSARAGATLLNISGTVITSPNNVSGITPHFDINGLNEDGQNVRGYAFDENTVIVTYLSSIGGVFRNRARIVKINGNTLSTPEPEFIVDDGQSSGNGAYQLIGNSNYKCNYFFRSVFTGGTLQSATLSSGNIVIASTTSDVNGLAKTSGTAGQTVEVFVNE